MRIPQNKEQKIKAILHGIQAALIFVAGCLALAVLTQDGGASGATGFFFALCFFSIPALIYQVMVLLWSRAWRFASIYAYACIDVLFAILWFAAAIAVAAWNAQTKPAATTDPKKTTRSMLRRDDNTSGACGARCGVSKASVSFAIIISLLFAATAFLAIRVVAEYRRTGVLPATNAPASFVVRRPASPEGDPSKDPWSSNTDELEPEPTDRLRYGQEVEEIEQGLLHRPSYGDDGQYPGRTPSYHSEVSLNPSIAYDQIPHTPQDGAAGNHVKFPTANYDATHM